MLLKSLLFGFCNLLTWLDSCSFLTAHGAPVELWSSFLCGDTGNTSATIKTNNLMNTKDIRIKNVNLLAADLRQFHLSQWNDTGDLYKTDASTNCKTRNVVAFVWQGQKLAMVMLTFINNFTPLVKKHEHHVYCFDTSISDICFKHTPPFMPMTLFISRKSLQLLDFWANTRLDVTSLHLQPNSTVKAGV